MSLRTWLSILLPDDNLAKMADCISFSRCFTMTSQAFHSLITCWYLAVIFSSIYKTNIEQWKNCSWLKRNILLHSYSVFLHKKMNFYLSHIFFVHPKLVVSQQKRPHLFSDLMLHPSIINQPQQLQLLIVLARENQRQMETAGPLRPTVHVTDR